MEQAELSAIDKENKLLRDQFERQEKIYEQGLVSQTQLQQRAIQYQNSIAKQTIIENKIGQTKQEILNIQIEKNNVEQEYQEKISKAEGEKMQTLASISAGQGDVAKLENQVSNYIIRNGMYVILAPQDGQIIKAKRSSFWVCPWVSAGTCSTNFALRASFAQLNAPLSRGTIE